MKNVYFKIKKLFFTFAAISFLGGFKCTLVAAANTSLDSLDSADSSSNSSPLQVQKVIWCRTSTTDWLYVCYFCLECHKENVIREPKWNEIHNKKMKLAPGKKNRIKCYYCHSYNFILVPEIKEELDLDYED